MLPGNGLPNEIELTSCDRSKFSICDNSFICLFIIFSKTTIFIFNWKLTAPSNRLGVNWNVPATLFTYLFVFENCQTNLKIEKNENNTQLSNNHRHDILHPSVQPISQQNVHLCTIESFNVVLHQCDQFECVYLHHRFRRCQCPAFQAIRFAHLVARVATLRRIRLGTVARAARHVRLLHDERLVCVSVRARCVWLLFLFAQCCLFVCSFV